MTADLLTQGTEKRSAREIAETIDFVGGTLQAPSAAMPPPSLCKWSKKMLASEWI